MAPRAGKRESLAVPHRQRKPADERSADPGPRSEAPGCAQVQVVVATRLERACGKVDLLAAAQTGVDLPVRTDLPGPARFHQRIVRPEVAGQQPAAGTATVDAAAVGVGDPAEKAEHSV